MRPEEQEVAVAEDRTPEAGAGRPVLGSRTMAAVAVLVLLFGGVGLALAVVAPLDAVRSAGASVPVELTEQARDTALAEVGPLPEGVRLSLRDGRDAVLLEVTDLAWPLRLLTASATALVGLCTAAGALILWRLLRDTSQGRPFADRNPARLVILAALVLGGGIGGQLLAAAASLAVIDATGAAAPGTPLEIAVNVEVGPALLAGVVLAVAEAFRRGRQLDREVEGLV